ncbi:hypothetical protein ACI2KR_08565 [Pseudomonas luteola]
MTEEELRTLLKEMHPYAPCSFEIIGHSNDPALNNEFLAKCGYVYWKDFGDHGIYGVMPTSFGKGRVCGDLDFGGYKEFWCFETLNGAIEALHGWDHNNSPEVEGWIRHVPSHRRRPNGDASLEHVAM